MLPGLGTQDELLWPIRYVAGGDISPSDVQVNAVGATVVLELPELQIVEAKIY